MSSAKIRLYRHLAFIEQNGKCFYCHLDMWECGLESYNDFNDRMCIWRHQGGFRRRMHKFRRCTAEHLIKREHGGRSVRSNIVAACVVCNTTRADYTVEEHMIYIEYFMKRNPQYYTNFKKSIRTRELRSVDNKAIEKRIFELNQQELS